jgi:hypothetical protein
MGAALFIIVDRPAPGFSTDVNGKAIAKALDRLNAAAERLGVAPMMSFVSISPEDLAGVLDDAPSEPSCEVVAKLGLTRDPAFMYFVKERSVQRVRKKRPGMPAAEPETVADLESPADPNWFYVIDEGGDVVRTPKARPAPRPAQSEKQWFEPEAVLVTLRALHQDATQRDDELVADDLARFVQVLEEAAKRNLKCRLAIDI